MKNIELLAPVGSFDALKAAVQNGANAVYLGGKMFSARASANNFDKEELKKAVEYAHIRDVQVFVTANTLIKQNEIKEFVEYIKYLYDINVDAVILQDIGMAKLIKKLLPDFELHASTQMVAHSIEDVKYLKSIGFDRVVVARELSVEEINQICKTVDVDIEVFVHGALCVCYSGQCLMSSMIGGRSGNRGRCAQPCRQKYQIVDINTGEEIETEGEYLLSPRDLNTIDEIDKIINAGVHSLKIEGRMKKPEYVGTVISSYRQTIDTYFKHNNVQVSEDIVNNLYTIFNRKFTKGYLLGEVGEEIMNSNRPNNVGLYIGKVLDYNKRTKRLKIALENTLKKGDGINLGGGIIGRIIKGDKSISDKGFANEIIELDFVGEAKRNQIVYKTSDSDLLNLVQKSFENEVENKKVDISAKIQIKLNQNPKLIFTDNKENSVEVEEEKLVEKAIKVALSKEKVIDQISKLGNTPYNIVNIELDIDEGVSMPISILNKLRRDAVEKLNEIRVPIKDRNYKDKKISFSIAKKNSIKSEKIRVKVKDLEQLKEVLKYNVDLIYYEDIKTLDEAVELAHQNNKKIAYSVPRILRNADYKILEKAKQSNIDGILATNLTSIKAHDNVYVDYSLNSFNSESINHYKNEGAKSIAISQELNLSEIEKTLEYIDIDIESLVYGYMPIMISEYCPMGVLIRDCKKNKRNEICNTSNYKLRDFKNEEYRISQDIFCRSTIYNSDPTMMIHELESLYNNGINIFRIEFTFEDINTINKIMQAITNALKNDFELDKDGMDLYNELEKNTTTRAHYYRGVE